MSQICISGLGAATCVGPDAANTAASVRAGISRFGPIHGTVTFDEDEHDAPLIGAPINFLTKGFVQQGRLLRLMESAFSDFLTNAKLRQDAIDWKQTPIIWNVLNVTEHWSWPEDEVTELLQQHLLSPLAKKFDLPLFTPSNGYFFGGNAGASRTLRGISKTLLDGYFSQMILITVDTLLEPRVLANLIAEGRMKDGDNPVGLTPGEAAVVTLVELQHTCQERGAKVEARLYNAVHDSVEIDFEEKNWRAKSLSGLAQALAEGILEVIDSFTEEAFCGDIYLDNNGEEWRAAVWGMAQVKLLTSEKIELAKCRQIVPAESWGDIGAASAAASLCLVARSFARNYASTSYALICSVSDDGDVGVILVGR